MQGRKQIVKKTNDGLTALRSHLGLVINNLGYNTSELHGKNSTEPPTW